MSSKANGKRKASGEIEGNYPQMSYSWNYGNWRYGKDIFDEKMTRRRLPPKKSFGVLYALGEYLEGPENYPSSKVIEFNNHSVFIYDRYPKSFIHTLLLPRDSEHNLKTPFEAFQNEAFFNQVKQDAEKLRQTVANDLRRRFRKFSKSEASLLKYHERVAQGDVKEGEEPPPGRDWLSEVKVGVHAVPSMAHLHVHVMTRDSYSQSVKNANHCTDFNGSFFMGLSEFPMTKSEYNERVACKKGEDLICWRCNKNFERRFKQFKDHMDIEFEAWKQE